MKKYILTLILIASAALSTNAQTLMLSVRKATIQAQMRAYPEYVSTVNASDYLEYQKDSIAIGYRFELNSGKLGKWICNEVYITMPLSRELAFIDLKTGCNCWMPIGQDQWLYQTNVFDTLVLVTRSYSDGCVTFSYTFDE